MKKVIISMFGCILALLMVLSITGCKNWNRTYGFGYFDCVEQTDDGGFIAGGWQEILKVNAQGNIQWKKSLNDWNSETTSVGVIVHQTRDGGYIAVEYVEEAMCLMCPTTFLKDVLIKLKANGKKEWEKTILSPDGTEMQVSSVQQTSDGGYVLTGGYTDADGALTGVLVKTDSSGIYQWTQVFEGYAFRAWENPAGGYSLIGLVPIDSHNYKTMIVKTDARGVEFWRKTYDEVFAEGFCVTDDGGAVLAAVDIDTADAAMLMIGADGDVVWKHVYPNTAAADGMGFILSVELAGDNGYVLGGMRSKDGWADDGAWVLRTDRDGNETGRWSNDFGKTVSLVGQVRPTLDGGYIIAGCVLPNDLGINQAWLAKTDANGNASDW
jgi:hypothetical protein